MIRNVIALLFISTSLLSQDSLYTRSVIKFLCSKKCFGRGYINHGLDHASTFLVNEFKTNKIEPLFGSSYTQSFSHPVNVIRKTKLHVNGNKLKPGIDYIVDPASPSISLKFQLEKKDSTTFISQSRNIKLVTKLSKKLTYSVATDQTSNCTIHLLKSNLKSEPRSLKLKVRSSLENAYAFENIGGYISGTNNDSLIVITAHYDHLGGMGKNTFFPGANDNASGISMVLNLMKYYSVNTPRYKTVFIFFTGEEAGLLGSKYFVDHPSIPLSNIKFLINLDLLGTGEDGIMVVNGAIHQAQFSLLQNINSETAGLKEIKKRGKAMNSDHYWFTEKGVPSFFIYTLGGVSYYHDVYDREETLPLTKYKEVFQLLTKFIQRVN